MLFDIPKDKPLERETSGGAAPFQGDQAFPNGRKLEDVLELVKSGQLVHWVSDGDWSMHDLLLGLLGITGPARVYLSSYAFSEYPARLMADLMSRKMILELHCLIDTRIDVRSASALNIIRNTATKLQLVKTHAKVTVVESESVKLVAIGSANYTTNKRYECGVVIVDPTAADFHKKWMLNAFNTDKRNK